MPHIHGVAWIRQSELARRTIKDGSLCDKDNSKAVAELADELISCQLPKSTKENSYEHPSLRKIVEEVQIHRHTPSYGFCKGCWHQPS